MGKTFEEECERIRAAGPPTEFQRGPDGLLGEHNIVGIAIGCRTKGKSEAPQSEQVVQYFVREKRALEEVHEEWRIEGTIDGKHFDVIEVGAGGLQSFQVPCGMTVGAGRGTGGCKLLGRPGGEMPFSEYLLTAGHVLAPEGHGPPGGEVHWAPLGLPTATSTRIGYLQHFTDLAAGNRTSADVGLVRIDGPLHVSAQISCHDRKKLPASRRQRVELQLPVWKCGAATGLTEGFVIGDHACGWVRYPGHPKSWVFVTDQILVQDKAAVINAKGADGRRSRFAGPGDSGAMVATDRRPKGVVGMLIAGSLAENFYFVTPIEQVFADLKEVGSGWTIQ